MANINYSLFSNFTGENKRLIATHFSNHYEISFDDTFNLLLWLNPTLEYALPGFGRLNVFENSKVAFDAGIERIRNGQKKPITAN